MNILHDAHVYTHELNKAWIEANSENTIRTFFKPKVETKWEKLPFNFENRMEHVKEVSEKEKLDKKINDEFTENLKLSDPEFYEKSKARNERNTIDIRNKRYEYVKSILDLEIYNDFVKSTKWCDQYILNTLEAQIKKAIDKNDKALKLIKKVDCAKENVDINLISIDICGNELKQIARSCAKLCFNLCEENQICFLKDLLKDFNAEENQKRLGINLPKIDFASSLKPEQLIKRLITQKWWNKKLRQTIERNRYSIFSHIGAVGKTMGQYAPIDAVENFKKKLAAQEAFLLNNSILNVKTGETRLLSNVASTAEKRFAQMYTIVKGLDVYSKELGLKAAFITLTAPAEYHCNPKHGKNSWNLSGYADQKETQEWISNKWNLVTMRLNKHNASPLGLRISEVHSDGTNHWHSIIFYKAEHETIIKNAIADVWGLTKSIKHNKVIGYRKTRKIDITKVIYIPSYEEVITEKMVTKKGKIKKEDLKRIGKIEHVLHKNSIAANWINIDERGSAASYICKYISKSCLFDASKKSKFNDQDEDSVIKRDKKFEEEYNSMLGVATTRSVFNLRSFQFYGLPNAAISLWLMYRRQQNDKIDNKLERLRRDAACKGDFCMFIKLIKGNTPKIDYDDKINGFGEIIKIPSGYTTKLTSDINLFIKNEQITEKTTFKYFNNSQSKKLITNDFIIVNNNDLIGLFDGNLKLNDAVRVIHNVPSRCAENQEQKRDIRLMNNFYDDDPIFWFTE